MEDSQIMIWISLAVAVLEVLPRLIPNEKIKGVLGYVLDFLKFVSDYLNREDKSLENQYKKI